MSKRCISLLTLFSFLMVSGLATADSGPDLVPAHPDLYKTLDRNEIRALSGGHTPEEEIYQEFRAQASFKSYKATTGTGSCLVILVEWTDHAADTVAHPAAAYDELMFSTGTALYGSMNDYYLENSHGAFGVAGLVHGWNVHSQLYEPIDPTQASEVRTQLAQLVTALDSQIDYAQFDNDGPDGVPDSGDDDGYVDAVFFVHAGPGREQTGDDNDIWSHAWAFSGGVPTNDGVTVYRYSVEPEMMADGTLMTMGVFAHEYGHVLGLPDLYDTDYTSSGIGEWGLMSGGSWGRQAGEPAGSSPSHMTAWSKVQMGWITPTVITFDQLGVTIPPSVTNPVAYRIFRDGTTSGDEYFLVENRQPIGFDASLIRRSQDFGIAQPQGLMIYHVDDAVSGNANEKHRLVDVVEASPWFNAPDDWIEHLDGPRDYALSQWLNNYNRADEGDVWPGWSATNVDTTLWDGPRDRNRFADDTVPNTHDYICDPTGIAIENITLSGSDVVADFLVGTPPATVVSPDKTLTWGFESDSDGWEFCNSFVHQDATQAGSCPGSGGLWFGQDNPDYACPPGYGNSWYDFTWKSLFVSTGATVSIRHHYDLETGYDYGYIEARCAGDASSPWVEIAEYNGSAACATDMYNIPASVITACDNGHGASAIDLRLRFTSDGAWSAEDGSFCGVGWWVDEVSISGEATSAVGDTPGLGMPMVLMPASPNPFNPITTLKFHVPAGARDVKLTVFDQRGRLVRSLDSSAEPGWREVEWDGRDSSGREMSSGIFFARLDVDGVMQTQKMALLK
jgi:immune inhibitor A